MTGSKTKAAQSHQRKPLTLSSLQPQPTGGATSYSAAQPLKMHLEELGTPFQVTGAGHYTHASGPNPHAGPLPTSCHQLATSHRGASLSSLAASPAAATPRGPQRGDAFFQRIWGARARPSPGKGRKSGRGAVPRGDRDPTFPLRREESRPNPQLSAPHLVAEAAGHQQVRAGRAVAAHGLLAAGAGQRVRHVTQRVGPRGLQGLGGPARHGAHRSGRAAAASSCCQPRRAPPAPGPRPRSAAVLSKALHRPGWEPPPPPPPAGSSLPALGRAAPRRAPPLRAGASRGVRSHLGPRRSASTATPPSPLAAPPPQRPGRPGVGRPVVGGRRDGRREEGRRAAPPRLPPRRKCALSPRQLSW